ncbi:MAG: BrnA antitoxin family protein [Candidatus Sumerlaeota bacterium]|nr:BrnA antitoxin family protein [Candidatus Sumerlaeota bacterium]
MKIIFITYFRRLKAYDLSDIPRLDANFFRKAVLRLPEPKRAVSIRLDPDVLDWLKKQGKGYQTRINTILRMYVEAQSPRYNQTKT